LLFDGCAQGAADNCAAVAAAYETGSHDGDPVRSDSAVARYFREHACDGNHAQSCYVLAQMTEQGRGTTVDLKLAESLYDKACKAEHAQACRAHRSLVNLRDSLSAAPVSSANIAKKIVSNYLSEVRECYDALLEIDPNARGKVTLTMNVSKKGLVMGARAKGFDSIMDNCIAVKAQGWTFAPPASKEDEQYVVPLVLNPE
jgi:hypothetical protein